MLSSRSRRLTALAAGALLLGTLAGCGGSDDDTKDAGAESSASASTSPSESASATPSTSEDAADEGEAAAPGERLTKDNLVPTMLAAMREKKTAHMSMEIGSSVSADADVRYADGGTEMRMSMTTGTTKAVVILVDGAVYMQQTAGAKFVKLSKDTAGVGEIIEQMSGLGPQSSIASMRGAVKKVEYAGTDTVDGTELTKYRVTADTAPMAASLGGTGGVGGLPKTVTYDLYVDEDHLMRRIDMTVAEQEISMVVSNWGKPVDIKAPPASQVASQ